MAKAIAGELDCPFVSQNGSDFVELYIGSGPLRVRELFREAKMLAKRDKNKRCIVFIDELDAVGEKRSSTDSHREYNSTLNCLLSEMDGFANSTIHNSAWERFFGWINGENIPKYQMLNIMVIGTTNREDILDKALLRPGFYKLFLFYFLFYFILFLYYFILFYFYFIYYFILFYFIFIFIFILFFIFSFSGRFDHIIEISLPDQEKRFLILKQYLSMYPIKSKINLVELSKVTEGMNCADLASIVKTAAKNAIMNNESGISEEHINEALEKIVNLKKKHLEFELK